MRWLRAPLVHFLVGGAVLYGLVHGTMPLAAPRSDTPRAPIVLTAADVERLRADYTRETGLAPTPADEAALVDKAIEDELLFREALARGLDRHDRSVRNWLVEQMHVLNEDRAGAPDELYARARALGLERTDLVVRRILVQKMRLLAARADERPPAPGELEAFYAAHADEYRAPGRVSFWHVFLASSPDTGVPTARAEALRERLRRDHTAPADAVRQGDAFVVPPHVVGQSAPQLAKLFGAEFAATVGQAAPEAWVGPVASAYGVHLVWVESREPGAPPPLETVRGRVLQRWQRERRDRRLVAFVRELASRQPLEVESRAWRSRGPS